MMLKSKDDKHPWIVYKLVNRTQKEIYFGISKRSMHSLHDHVDAEIPCTKHWDFVRNDIEHHVIYTGLSDASAKSHAKDLAKLPHLTGFKVINTFKKHA